MSTIIPTIGRIVQYKLSEADAEQINRRRDDADANRIKVSRGFAPAVTGSQKHIGNRAEAGHVYPMVIVRTWGTTPESAVNGQVLLDGNDTLWVTSVTQGAGERRFVFSTRDELIPASVQADLTLSAAIAVPDRCERDGCIRARGHVNDHTIAVCDEVGYREVSES